MEISALELRSFSAISEFQLAPGDVFFCKIKHAQMHRIVGYNRRIKSSSDSQLFQRSPDGGSGIHHAAQIYHKQATLRL